MKFTAKFLNPIPSHRTDERSTGDTNPSLLKIYNVMRTHDGRVEGEDEDLVSALRHRDYVTVACPHIPHTNNNQLAAAVAVGK